jgi:hypothetical protein
MSEGGDGAEGGIASDEIAQIVDDVGNPLVIPREDER